MLLLVDVGNTHTRLVLWREGQAVARTRVDTRPDRMEREARVALGEMTAAFGDGPRGACIASVVPASIRCVFSRNVWKADSSAIPARPPTDCDSEKMAMKLMIMF